MAKAVIGLGNPGPQYVGTRHNAGFDVIDRVAGLLEVTWKGQFSGLLATTNRNDEKLYLLKPGTFMNLSGNSVAQLVNYFKIEPHDVLVISDDYNLPLGKMRIRESGSAGGHNGLSSIISVIGEEFPRLRIGIGDPKGETVDFVLSRFSPVERETFDIAVRYAADAVLDWADSGTAKIQEKYNSLDLSK